MLSSLFVDRPRLAIVIAIVTTIAGLLALYAIPIAPISRHRAAPGLGNNQLSRSLGCRGGRHDRAAS
jgi:hypothetical protein